MADMLHPFEDEYNRVENIVIQFENCLYAYNYAVIRYFLENNYEHWVKILPMLEEYHDLPKEVVFTASFLYSSDNLITKLSKDTLTYQEGIEILNMVDELLPYDDAEYLTNVAIGLIRIINSVKIEKLRIFSTRFNQTKLDCLGVLFEGDDYSNKAVAYQEESISQCLKDNWDDITTIYMEDVEELFTFINEEENLSYKDKVFFLPQTPFNALPKDSYRSEESSFTTIAPLKYRNIFNQLEVKEKCQINIFPLNIN